MSIFTGCYLNYKTKKKCIIHSVKVKNSSQNKFSADCRPTVGQHIMDTLPTVGRQIPYSGEIVISVLAFNRYNLVNVARDRSQNS